MRKTSFIPVVVVDKPRARVAHHWAWQFRQCRNGSCLKALIARGKDIVAVAHSSIRIRKERHASVRH